MVQDLLVIAKLEHHELQLALESFRVADLIEEVSQRRRAAENAVALRISADERAVACADRALLRADTPYARMMRAARFLMRQRRMHARTPVGAARPSVDVHDSLAERFVLGRPEPLRASHDDQEAVAQRMAHYAVLRPLSRDEATQYIEHRCTIAGAARVPFDTAAIDAVYEITRVGAAEYFEETDRPDPEEPTVVGASAVEFVLRHHHVREQHLSDEHEKSTVAHTLCEPRHQPLVVHSIEELLHVEIAYPRRIRVELTSCVPRETH